MNDITEIVMGGGNPDTLRRLSLWVRWLSLSLVIMTALLISLFYMRVSANQDYQRSYRIWALQQAERAQAMAAWKRRNETDSTNIAILLAGSRATIDSLRAEITDLKITAEKALRGSNGRNR